MAEDPRQGLGRRGEQLAADYLVAQGFTIVERNWRCAEGEIDIVAREEEVWAFVEVRTRRGRRGPSPEQSLTPRKWRKLIELAQLYLYTHQMSEETAWRIDFVAVEMDERGTLQRVELFRNAITGW